MDLSDLRQQLVELKSKIAEIELKLAQEEHKILDCANGDCPMGSVPASRWGPRRLYNVPVRDPRTGVPVSIRFCSEKCRNHFFTEYVDGPTPE